MKFKLISESYSIKEIETLDYSGDQRFSAVYLPKSKTFIKFKFGNHVYFHSAIYNKQLKNIDNSKQIITALEDYYDINDLAMIGNKYSEYLKFYKAMDWITFTYDRSLAIFTCPNTQLIEDLLMLYIYLDRSLTFETITVDFYNSISFTVHTEFGQRFPTTKARVEEILKNLDRYEEYL